MRFAAGFFAVWFWLVALTALVWFWAFKHKRKLMRAFADEELLAFLSQEVSFSRQKIKAVLLILALVLNVIALMQPQWGFSWQAVSKRGLDILVAIDTSKSMLASDIKPNRLQRSKLAVRDLVENLSGDRIGLIAFSGSAYLACPLTVDYNGFLLSVNDLDTTTIPVGGTSLSSAIERALDTLKGVEKKYKVMIIITDGEDHQGQALAVAQKAAEAGIKIFCVGVGSPEGELIQVTDESGKSSFLKDADGNVVKTRLNEELLEQVASQSGGAYIRASGAEFGLELLYREKLSSMEKREIKASMEKFYHHRYQLFIALALGLLIAERFIVTIKKHEKI